MKTVTITKKTKSGEVLGTMEVEKPETFAELVEQFEEKDIVTLAWRSFVIDMQRDLDSRKATKRPETELERAFKKMSPEKQAEALEHVAMLDSATK